VKNYEKLFDNTFGENQITSEKAKSDRMNPCNLNNNTEIYENRFGNLNLSSTIAQNNGKETPTQELICKELFYARRFNKKGKISERVKDKLNGRISDERRSVISSDNDGDTSSRRVNKEVTKNMMQSFSSKTKRTKRFVIKKSSIRAKESNPNLSGMSDYRINKRLAGILERQLQVLMKGVKPQSNPQYLRNLPTNEDKKLQFLPYKDISKFFKREERSRSQKGKRNLTTSNSKLKERRQFIQNTNTLTRANHAYTPRYKGNGIRLINGKHVIPKPLLKSQNSQGLPRHNRSALRSNSNSRSSKCRKLAENSKMCNYTQDEINQHTITDKSHSISRDSANISLTAARKDPQMSLHRLKFHRKSHNVSHLNEESFELYTRTTNKGIKIPKN
jgi:hypothetical protein